MCIRVDQDIGALRHFSKSSHQIVVKKRRDVFSTLAHDHSAKEIEVKLNCVLKLKAGRLSSHLTHSDEIKGTVIILQEAQGTD